MSETSELSSSPLSQLSNFHQSRSKLISMLRHFYEKLFQTILQSRLNTSNLVSPQDHWFNLLYQSEPIHLDLSWMDRLSSDLPVFLQPTTLEIILSWKHLNDNTKIYFNQNEISKEIKSVVLEKWLISLDDSKKQDLDIKSVYKFACQYFRLLLAILKRLPAHNLLKSEKSKIMKRFGWHVTFNLYSQDPPESDAFPLEKQIDNTDERLSYDMPVVDTQIGAVMVKLDYRSPANFSMSSKSEIKMLLHRKPDTQEELQRKLDGIVSNIPKIVFQNHSQEDEVKIQQQVLKLLNAKIAAMKQDNYEEVAENEIFRMSFMDLSKLAE
eukprot:NODE_202_length_14999_cov_0.270067.p7 type:complete len:325 gc:universal NODE_202_length_14999_cov_0.270067:14333-13359(-)